MYPERLKGIDIFVAVVETGTFTAAAQRLKLTNSAVGKAITRLEHRLGSRLFVRTTRRLTLTDAGQSFYRTCGRLLAELGEAEAMLGAERTQAVGRLRIDLPVSFGRLHVLPPLFEFFASQPGLRPHVTFSDRFVDLVADDVDIAVRLGGPDVYPPTIGQVLLGHEQVILCSAPSYLQRSEKITGLDDLAGHELIVYRKADGSTTPWIMKDRETGQSVRRSMEGHISLEHGEAEVAAVVAGLGIAQLPTWLAQAELEGGKIEQILPQANAPGLPIRLLWQTSRQSLPKVELALACLRSVLSATVANLPNAMDAGGHSPI